MKPTYRKAIRLLDPTIVGDHTTLEWQTRPGAPVRTFDRQTTRLEADGSFTVTLKPKASAKGPQPLALGVLKPEHLLGHLLGVVAPVSVE